MSNHVNADGSNTDGVRVESQGKFISHQIGVVISSSAQLTVPTSAIQCIVQADGNDVRYTLDGTVPTTSSGVVLKNGTSIILSNADATAAKFIATAAALLNAVYTL